MYCECDVTKRWIQYLTFNEEAVLVAAAVAIAVASERPDTVPGPRTPRMEMECLFAMGLELCLSLCCLGLMRTDCSAGMRRE
jgi:hypothetical protein